MPPSDFIGGRVGADVTSEAKPVFSSYIVIIIIINIIIIIFIVIIFIIICGFQIETLLLIIAMQFENESHSK